ncbi:MAG: hypothetical protein LUP99_01525 [Methanomicrobiales archaeon]|nr:hypothetical protein [Methanomicrobiales archaeon]
MNSSQYLVIAMLCIAVCMGVSGCLQQVPSGNNTNQTCTAGTCPTPTGCSNATGTCPAALQNITSFNGCVAAGYPVMESYPRQCHVPGGPTFVENISQLCTEAGGNWNECSNRCPLDNAGNPTAICTAMCEPLCECGGITGFLCPLGYTCKTPAGIADALGYCVPESGGNLTRDQAYALALNSTCVQEGNLTNNSFYNPNSHTWWIDLVPNTSHPGCNPACVVDVRNGASEVNWRCTGLLPP